MNFQTVELFAVDFIHPVKAEKGMQVPYEYSEDIPIKRKPEIF